MADIGALALRRELLLVSPGKKHPAIDLVESIDGLPLFTSTMEQAATFEIVVDDYHRKLLRSEHINERSWVHVAGVRFELVKISKGDNLLTLTFEDAIAASLRRVKGPRVWTGATRAEIVRAIANTPRSKAPLDVDDDKRGPVAAPVRLGGKNATAANGWDLEGVIAEEVNWRRYTTGLRHVVGSDEFIGSLTEPVRLSERTPGVVTAITFDLDVGKKVDTAGFTVDTTLFGMLAGTPVDLERMGPADGRWLVSEFARPLTSTRATITLVRPVKALKEPKRVDPGDPGDPDNLPGQGGDDAGGTAGNAARERMVSFALAQAGDSYVWGANGPDAWDCSGLVQAATAYAGRTLAKPSASQWGTCVNAGKTISVAAALGIRGALLFRIGGEYNHVAISLGNGSTIEARGSAYGTGVFGGAAGGGWTGAALWI